MPLTIEDRLEIAELVARYNWALDSGDADAYIDTFTHDGVFRIVGGREYAGHEALRTIFARPRGSSRHWVTNMVMDGDGDTATMRCYLTVMRGLQITNMGRYENRLRRVGGRWKFVSRDYTPDSGSP